MSTLTAQAEIAATALLKADEDQLYEQLGMRISAMGRDPLNCGAFDMSVVYDHAEMGLKDDIKLLGKKIFSRWNAEAYQIVCGSEAKDTEDRKKLIKAVGVSDATVAAILSAMLVSTIGVAPAIAAVIAAIVVKRFCRPVYEEFCQAWKKHLTPVN